VAADVPVGIAVVAPVAVTVADAAAIAADADNNR
jgi:hypothetical protein